MYIQVRLLKGFKEPLWYHAPDGMNDLSQGGIVRVPLRNQLIPARIEKISTDRPNVEWQIRTIDSIESVPHDDHYDQYVQHLCTYYQLPALYFAQRLRSFLKTNERQADQVIAPKQALSNQAEIILTDEQRTAVDGINANICEDRFSPILLNGLTGSGKTEVYKKALTHAITKGKSVIVLLPEVSLAAEFTRLFRDSLPLLAIFGFHSATSVKEKRQLWQQLLAGRPVVIIGVHLPIMLPIANLGLIIIDEEHDQGYQEKKHPRINSKEAALLRAQLYKIPIVLGSATPSISTIYAARTKSWQTFALTKRYAGCLPTIKVVQFDKYQKRPHFWISKELYGAIHDRLQKKEQIILFLNRRGYSFFVQCKECAAAERCTQCSVTLTLHDHGQLMCHYCGFTKMMPLICSACKAGNDPFLKKGIGTQQLVAIIEELFPAVRIARADVDSTVNKKKWQQTMKDFQNGSIDILIGTQTITKGYHFPKVTLVGIIWADLNLHFPLFNAAENTLQQLIQVAGRAGRATAESLVIVQTMMEHQIFSYLREQDYMNYYDVEIEMRKEVGYPPIKRFVEIELKHVDERMLEREAHQLATELRSKAAAYADVLILGPVKPVVYKVAHIASYKIYCKALTMDVLQKLYASVSKDSYHSSLYYTPHPLS